MPSCRPSNCGYGSSEVLISEDTFNEIMNNRTHIEYYKRVLEYENILKLLGGFVLFLAGVFLFGYGVFLAYSSTGFADEEVGWLIGGIIAIVGLIIFFFGVIILIAKIDDICNFTGKLS